MSRSLAIMFLLGLAMPAFAFQPVTRQCFEGQQVVFPTSSTTAQVRVVNAGPVRVRLEFTRSKGVDPTAAINQTQKMEWIWPKQSIQLLNNSIKWLIFCYPEYNTVTEMEQAAEPVLFISQGDPHKICR